MAPVSRAASEAAKPQTRRQSGVKDAPKSKDGPKKATTPLKVKPATEKKEKPAAAKKAKASHPPFLEMIQVSSRFVMHVVLMSHSREQDAIIESQDRTGLSRSAIKK